MKIFKWDSDKDAMQVAILMVVALVVGAWFVAAATPTSGTAFAGLMWAAACSSVGWFLGFLFGIPRSLSTDTARTRTPAQVNATARDQGVLESPDMEWSTETPTRTAEGTGPSTAVNTNLEQISDWLTKIIVGVTLVESKAVLDWLSRGANLIALSLGGGQMKSLALAIMIYFLFLGLLGSYLLTRLFLQRAFTDAAGDRR